MTSSVESLQSELARLWDEFQALEPRPEDAGWVRAAFVVLHRSDQDFRLLYKPALLAGDDATIATLRPAILAADVLNRAWLKRWLVRYPWPTAGTYGEEAAQTAWLVCLHSDCDVAFQREMFAVLEGLFRAGEVSPVHYAGLHDRIAINEDRPQRWGMFYHLVGEEEVLYPVENPSVLGDRRRELGLADERFHR